jgi:peptide/nickel transport system substrate-binding protein
MRRALRQRSMLGHLHQPDASRGRAMAAWAVGALACALAAAGCAAGASPNTGHAPRSGGSVSYALPANETPNYIFPFTPGQYFTVVNTDNLQYLLYRPLYWFGDRAQPFLNPQRSLAEPPSYHGQTLTIRMKHGYKWSNNEPVTAQDVVFWMNMMKAVVKQSTSSVNWGGYVPGYFPDNVTNIHAASPYEVQMTIIGHYSRKWFTYNELSQVTPMPQAWDTTGPGKKSDCTHNVGDCLAVFKYLDKLSKDPSTWARSSSLWRIVDGPWQLTNLDSQGVLTFSYNDAYSGPVPRHHITEFKELPFTSEEAEYNVLAAGGSNALDVGYLPTVNAPVPPPGSPVGQNPVAGYRLQPVYTWGLSYFPYNFGSANPQLPIIRQQYFRQAIQLLEDQAAIIQGPLHGYGHVTTGPVGSYPRTLYLSPQARQGDQYSYNPVLARRLLANHGWTINPGGISTCQRPGTGQTQCGQGVHAGAQLKFELLYATGQAWLESAVLQLKSNASQVGIDINLEPKTFNGVLAEVEGAGCPAAGCPWQMADWGFGWSYVPDYLPTGDVLFQSGSFANLGNYRDAHNDALIKQTLDNSDLGVMYTWQDYLTKQLPVVFQPAAPHALVESVNNLHIGTLSSTLAINPEEWYFLR